MLIVLNMSRALDIQFYSKQEVMPLPSYISCCLQFFKHLLYLKVFMPSLYNSTLTLLLIRAKMQIYLSVSLLNMCRDLL